MVLDMNVRTRTRIILKNILKSSHYISAENGTRRETQDSGTSDLAFCIGGGWGRSEVEFFHYPVIRIVINGVVS